MRVRYLRRMGQHKTGAVINQDSGTARWLMRLGYAVAVPTAPDREQSEDDANGDVATEQETEPKTTRRKPTKRASTTQSGPEKA